MIADPEIVAGLIKNSILFATVESCTGGLIAHRVTEVAGSSAAFWGGWVTYDNRAKIELGVPASTLAEHGAVSKEVATAMACAAWKKVEASFDSPRKIYSVATTGIAGPGGGSDKKPVGLCCIAVASGAEEAKAFEVRAPLGLNRSETKRYFADQALHLLSQEALK